MTEREWIYDEGRIHFIFQHKAHEYNRDAVQSNIYQHKMNRKWAIQFSVIFACWIVFAICVFDTYPEPLFWMPVMLIFEISSLYGISMRAFKKSVRKELRDIQDREKEDAYDDVCQLVLSDEGVQVRCMNPKTLVCSYPYARKSKVARFFLRGAVVVETEDFFVFSGVGSAFWIRKNSLVKGDINDIHSFLRDKGVKMTSATLRTTEHERKLQSIIAEEMNTMGVQ